MKKKLSFLLALLVMVVTGAWADTVVLSTPSESVATLSDANGIVTLTDANGSTGIQQGSRSYQMTYDGTDYVPMKLNGSRNYTLSYKEGVTISKVTLLAMSNGDAEGTVGAGNGDATSLGTLPARNAEKNCLTVDITGKTGLRGSRQWLALIVVEYSTTEPALTSTPNALNFALNPSVTSKTQTFTITGQNLKNGVYALTLPNLAGLSVNPASFEVTDGKVNQEIEVTYAETADVAKAETTIGVAVGELSANVAVSYQSRSTAYTQSTVSEAATWDWSALSETVELGDNTTPTKSEEFLLADLDDRINFTEAFGDPMALKMEAMQFPTRGGFAQGTTIKFNTAVAGVISVAFSNTGGNRPYRHLFVNGKPSGFKSNASDIVKATDIAVPAGEVVLSGWLPTDGDESTDITIGNTNMLRWYSITFTPAEPVATKTIYMRPGIWASANEPTRYAVYMFNETDNAWLDMTAVEGDDGTFTANVPENYGNIILVRMDGTKPENNWNNKWNQTADINFAQTADKTLFTISSTDWGSDKTPFETSEYTGPIPVETKYKVILDDGQVYGTVEADKYEAAEGEQVALKVAVKEEYQNTYELDALSVTGADKTAIETSPMVGGEYNYSFKMPAQDVYVSATFKEKGGGEPAEPVVFTFNTDDGIAELGIAKPEAGKGTELNTLDPANTLTKGVITISNVDGGSTATRVWNSSGTLDLRIYKGSTLTFTTSEKNITKIELEGAAATAFTADGGEFAAGVWEGTAQSVTLTATANGKINTITVTYGEGGDTPQEKTYKATFTTNKGWNAVYAYTWSGEGDAKVEQLGEWPGTALEATEGVYAVSITTATAPEFIIFNNGNNGEENQTPDWKFENNKAYEFNDVVPTEPLTIAEAVKQIDAAQGKVIEGVSVQGIISKIDSYNQKYGSITYWISADGSTEGQQFEVYSGLNINGEQFKSKDDIEVGAKVVVTGNIKKYNDIYEFDYNNQLVSYEAPQPAEIQSLAINGTFPGMSWDADKGIAMTQDAKNPGIWTLKMENVEVEGTKYEYKAFANGETTGYQLPSAEDGNNDFVFGTVKYPAGNYNLLFTANTKTHKLTLEVSKNGINTIKELNAQDDATEFSFVGKATVAAKVAKGSTNYVYIYDEEAASLIFDKEGTYTEEIGRGNVITAPWTGKVQVSNKLFEVVPTAALGATSTVEVKYPEVAANFVVADNANKVVEIKGLAIESVSRNNISFTIGDAVVPGYNQFTITLPTEFEGKTFDVVGAVGIYGDKVQFWPIKITDVTPVVSTFTANFKTDKNWEKVYAYAWTGTEGQEGFKKFLGDWPGEPLTLNAETSDYEVTIKATEAPGFIIFNDGTIENPQVGDNKTIDYPFENGATYTVTTEQTTAWVGEKELATEEALPVAASTLAYADVKAKNIISIKATEVAPSRGMSGNTTDLANTDITLLKADDTVLAQGEDIKVVEGGYEYEVADEATANELRTNGFKVKANVPVKITSIEVQEVAEPEDIVISPESGDIADALAKASEGKKVGNITINLTAGGAYTIGSSIVAPASVTINGADGAVIDASELAGNFIQMAATYDQTDQTATPTKWTVADIAVKNVTIKGLKKALFYSTQKMYVANDFTIDNCIVEQAADATTIDYTKGSTAKNITVTNSTFYAPTATTQSFYSSQGGQKTTDYNSDAVQTFKFENNTMYNLALGKNFFTHRQSNQKWMAYNVKNNIFVNCGKSGQTIKGMNGGQGGANPTWTIDGNIFNFEVDGVMTDKSAAEDTGDTAEPVTNSVKGIAVFTDAAAGNFNGTFMLAPETDAPASMPGDPRWTLEAKASYAITIADGIANGSVTTNPAGYASKGVKVAVKATPASGYAIESITVMNGETKVDLDKDDIFAMPEAAVTVSATFSKAPVAITIAAEDITDGNINTAIDDKIAALPEGDKAGNITITLAENGKYTVTKSIEASASLTITGNGATIDASALEAAMIITPTGDLTRWMVGDLKISGVTVKGLKKAFYASAGKNYLYNDFLIDNSVIEITGTGGFEFDFRKGGVAKNFTINKSTLYAPTATGNSLYTSQSAQKGTDAPGVTTQTFAITNSTLYNIAKSKNFFTHRQNSQKWLKFVAKNNIFVNCGKSGQVIKGMNGGGSSANPVWDIDGNIFNYDGADTSAAESTDDTAEPVTNSVKGVISFVDAANGDFNAAFLPAEGQDQPATIPGDPRWTITAVKQLYVIGDASVNGWGSDTPAAPTAMTLKDGSFEVEFTSMAANAYFAIVDKGDAATWEELSGHRYGIGDGDQTITLDTPTDLVKFDNGTIVIDGAGKYKVSVSADMKVTVTKTGDVEHTYTVAGSFYYGDPATEVKIFGDPSWDASNTANDMEKQTDGTYKKVYENVVFENAGNIQFKVVEDHAWDISYGWDATADNPNGNAFCEITGTGTGTITIIFNPEGATAQDKVKIEVTGVPTGINGINVDAAGEQGVYYNLQGVRVANPGKGVYIKNGKKVLVK